MDQKVLYMIIRPIKPYILDIFHVCALPNGFMWRTRWREKWLSDTVIQTELKAGKKILIVVYDEENDLYYPVRWAEFVAKYEVGKIYRFDFYVRDFISFESSSKYVNKQIKDFSDYFKDKNKHIVGPNVNVTDRKNVFITSDYSKIKNLTEKDGKTETEVEAWGNVTKKLAEIKEMEGKEFIKIVDFRTLNGKEVAIDKGRFILDSNQLYEIRILQHIYESSKLTDICKHEMVLQGPPEHVNILKKNATLVGKYDYISLKFKTLAMNKKENSYIEVCTDNSHLDTYNSYNIELPVCLNAVSKGKTIISLILAALFAFVLVFNPTVFNLSEEIVEIIRILLIVTTMSASDAVSIFASKEN